MPLQNLRQPRLLTQPHADWVARFAPNTGLTSPRLSFPAGPPSILAFVPTELRKLFNGLWVAATQLHEDPLLQGALLVFANRSRDRVNLLHWEGTGV